MKKTKSIAFIGFFLAVAGLAGCTSFEGHQHNYGDPTWSWGEDLKADATFTCADCQEGVEKINATVTNSVTREATCTVEEQKTYVAKVSFNGKEYSDSKVVTGNKTDHTYGTWTKKDDNQHQKTCSCGDVIVENHSWNAGVVTTQPTHLVKGVKTFTCSACNATKTEEVAMTTEHTYSSYEKKDANQHNKVCACGDKVAENHSWNAGEVTTQPTHLAKGEKTFTCTKCGQTKAEEIAMTTEHTYSSYEKKDANQHNKVCACGDKVAEDHDWVKKATVSEPTFSTNGEDTYECSKCKETKSVVTSSNQLYPFNYSFANALVLDNSTEWGKPDGSDFTSGIACNLDAIKKWSRYTSAGKSDLSGITNSQFIGWAASAAEINDGVAEQVFANKVKVSNNNFVFKAGTDTDSNSINVRLNVITSDNVVHTIVPSAATGATAASNNYYTIAKGQWFIGASLTYDLSAYLNQEVVIAIEVDQPAEGNPTIWLNCMGFYSKPLSREIKNFSSDDIDGLTLDNSTEWGKPDGSDFTKDIACNLDAIKKWSRYTSAGKSDLSGITNSQFIGWAASAAEINDGVAEQVFANKVKVSNNNFVFKAGTDTDSNSINVRLNVITSDKVVHTIVPSAATGATAASNNYYTIAKGQWFIGASLTYDLSAYLNQEVVIAIEVDQPAEGNPTIWLNCMGFYAA